MQPNQTLDSAAMIRRATPADASSIFRVHIASIRGISEGHYSEAQINGWCADRRPESYLRPIAEQFMAVAEVFGEVAGFAQLSIPDATIEAVYVHPRHSRQGIGMRLMNALETAARSADLPALRLQASLNAVPFYKAAGYVPGSVGHHAVAGGVTIACIAMFRSLE